jgi:hypothetical protein
MRKTTLLIISFLSYSLFAQENNIMSAEAFSRLVKKDISYAILGERSPAQGFRCDLSDPKININALVYSKNRHLISTDFEGKISDGKFTVFDNNKFNSSFSVGLNYHYILNGNAYRWTGRKGEIAVAKSRIEAEKKAAKGTKKSDEDYYYMSQIIGAKINQDPSDSTPFYGIQRLKNDKSDNKSIGYETEINHQKALVLSAKYIKGIEHFENFYQVLSKVKNDSTLQIDMIKLLDDFRNYNNKSSKKSEELLDFEIDMLKPYWTVKKLQWISLYSSLSRQKFLTYDQSLANLQSNFAIQANLLSANYNINVLTNDYVLYFRTGAGLALTNNLSAFKRREFTRIDTLENLPGRIYLEETKAVAYFTNGGTVGNALRPKIDAEIYFVPFRKLGFTPGLYAKAAALFGKTLQVPAEMGIVFNVQSRVKDRNFFSLLPFLSFDNLLDIDSETGNGGVRNWKLGLKMGLPIHVGR